MDKLKMHTINKADENYQKLVEMFPNAITETMDENGNLVRAIDKDILMQEINVKVVDGQDERYQFTWPDKKKSILLANLPTNKTLRPCKEESVGKNGTKGEFDSENLYIEGDNLEVLKLLRETYLGKIKMIYIDPPYNTGNDFIYSDNFTCSTEKYRFESNQFDEYGNRLIKNIDTNGRFHTDWLNMIYTRIKLSKDLLKDDGVIFISIDDNEVDNLRKVCDEIFGHNNFIAHIIHKNNSMKNQSKYIGISSEFILIYAKDILELKKSQPSWRCKKKGASEIISIFNKLKKSNLSLNEIQSEIRELYARPKYTHLSRWNKVDELGIFMDSDLSRSNGYKDFTIINPETGKKCVIPNRGWGKTKSELEKLQKQNLIWYGDEKTPPRMKSYLSEDSESVFDNFIFADTSSDKKLLDNLFGYSVFEFPKSLEMMKQILSLCTLNDDIVLDFFSGSSTTAHALMCLNAEDKAKRKFIMVQIPEKISEKSEAFKHGYNDICEIGKERIRRASKKIKYETDVDIDYGFRVLKCDASNMKDVYYNPSEYNSTLIDTLEDNIKKDRTSEDLLFQVMLDLGILLSSKIEENTISGKKVFNVDDNYLIACFDDNITEDVIVEIAKQKPYYFVLRDASLASDSVATNFDQIFATYSPDTVRKVL